MSKFRFAVAIGAMIAAALSLSGAAEAATAVPMTPVVTQAGTMGSVDDFTVSGFRFQRLGTSKEFKATPTPGAPDRLPADVSPDAIKDFTITSAAQLKTTRADGCTGVPDGLYGADFTDACNAHDACYGPWSQTSRLQCDKWLLIDLTTRCNDQSWNVPACVTAAGDYYAGVRLFGKSHYEGTGDPS